MKIRLKAEMELGKHYYYISSGMWNNFYTLRVKYLEKVFYRGEGFETWGNLESRIVERDYYVRNLSIDKEEAIRKAKEYLSTINVDADFSVNFDVTPIGERNERRENIDWSVLEAGKYKGQSIYNLKDTDPQYLIWLAENNANNPRYEGTVALIKDLFKEEFDRREQEKLQEAQKTDEKKSILQPLAVAMREGYPQSGFAFNIATDLENGIVPKGKGLSILIDMLGKLKGRGNSKAYLEERERVMEILDKAGAKVYGDYDS